MSNMMSTYVVCKDFISMDVVRERLPLSTMIQQIGLFTLRASLKGHRRNEADLSHAVVQKTPLIPRNYSDLPFKH